ncbi:glucose/arabinose dehydrogenase/PKD repeat protein [Saccharopolyspora lacisalsi]|uniref:Glucose/arabinose dehydrogenase/PKD repeat protein n=1 Tax=Halosaccharopolyspora lacisalsi TaxID=1000566 RepID=A0A839DVV6_9PSEU|nr:ThuA domain-containing protein [Halosaccharopolyspora lacisalsi]MBA8824899.1 glucose/arabinose dehydrogenase/PKD repeat protein [Halosaccharopolyspora lacisalsi]
MREATTNEPELSHRSRWRTRLRSTAVVLLATLTGLAGGITAQAHPGHEHSDEPQVLVFSRTEGYRHQSIPSGIRTIERLGDRNGFTVETTEDAGAFTDANLDRFDAVVWLSTTGDVLDDEQQAAFERYVRSGGGYAGVHAASDTEYQWPWYGDLVGAYFRSHPSIQQATVDVEDRGNVSTRHLPKRWQRTDEWYNYRDNPREDVHVLASLDESTYRPGAGAMGDHPIAWCHDFDGGRSWYTGGGHTEESYTDPKFVRHLLGGIRTAIGSPEANCGAPGKPENPGNPGKQQPPPDSAFEQLTLAKGEREVGEPMAMAVLPDRRVLHTSRSGEVYLTTPRGSTTQAARVPVYNHDEDGLQGIAVDPNFAENRWVYLYYAPELDTPPGDAPKQGDPADFAPFEGHNQLSRFKLVDGKLDMASEQQILRVNTDRGLCCHAGGEIDFAQGDLYLSTGDDTNPFASNGYTPIDERADRNPAFDAQRSAGNTNDLRGKLLRITVQPDGSYTVPEGNLFPESEDPDDKTRPEIYAMGFRNPFRFSVDEETGWIHLGDYGPDAGSSDPDRGPGGTVEFNLIKKPGNYGWPYCVGDNKPFVDYDFATGESGEPFDCAAPKNTSPHNTGLVDLPPVQPAWLPYDDGSVPALGSGPESPMGGPTYHYDPSLKSPTKFPKYFDDKVFNYEWDRGWIKEFTLGKNGGLTGIKPFFASMDLIRPMNLEFGPQGSLYVLDYGSSYFGGAADSALYRIDHSPDSKTPDVSVTADKTSGRAPLTVTFDPAGTEDPEGEKLSYAWDFTDDGTVDSTEAGPVSFTYEQRGAYTATLAVTDADGKTGYAGVRIVVGNTPPQVQLELPPTGGTFAFGDQVPFEVTVTDAEDTEIDCSRVKVSYALGHDTHAHPLSEATGCKGVIETPADEGHGLDADLFGVIKATYTDSGSGDLPPVRGSERIVLQPKNKQAEFFDEAQGVELVEEPGAAGGTKVGAIDPGDWISVDPVDLTGVEGIGYRVSASGSGGTVEVRSGAPDGPLVSTAEVPGSGTSYVDIAPAAVTDRSHSGPLYFVFRGAGSDLLALDEIHFSGPGVSGSVSAEQLRSKRVAQGTLPRGDR